LSHLPDVGFLNFLTLVKKWKDPFSVIFSFENFLSLLTWQITDILQIIFPLTGREASTTALLSYARGTDYKETDKECTHPH
jgi:hypothetical protein